MNPYNNGDNNFNNPAYDANATRIFNPGAAQPAAPGTSGAARRAATKRNAGGVNWAKRGAAAAGGVLLGTVAAVASNYIRSGNDADNTDEYNEAEAVGTETAYANTELNLTDGQITCAQGNYDDMSFGEAFAAVRAQYGPGAVFEWRGGVYGSYTADEWNNMSADERADYANHVNWGTVNAGSSDMAQHTSSNSGAAPTETDHTQDVAGNHTTPAQSANNGSESAPTQETASNNIEVLDSYTDPDTGANYVSVNVNGSTAVLVDQNGDQVFDYMASDLNGNGRLDEGEIVDISEANIAMADLNVQPHSITPEPAVVEPEPADGYEITEVYTDPETGANYVAVNVDGTDAVFADVDGDQTFDYLVVDANGNGEVDPGETIDISNDNIAMSDLGLGSDDGLDYACNDLDM